MSTILQANDISKVYPSGEDTVTALNHLSLEFDAGRITAIVGPSGSGKSTLLNLLAGFDVPSSGNVKHNGNDITAMLETNLASYRLAHFGFIFQNYNLVSILNAQENVELPLSLANVPRLERTKRAKELLSRVGLAKRITHRPNQLSGGEQQRVAIARAVANAPRVLLADEPTGNLDPRTAGAVFDSLGEIVRATRLAALVATHNMDLAARMDRRVTLREGRVVELA